MTPCDVCGLPGEPMASIRPVFHDEHSIRRTRIEWVPAPSPGNACSPECATLIRVRSERTPDEQKLTAWRWRKRRAEARGLPFDEPLPMTDAERRFVVWLSLHNPPAHEHYLRGHPSAVHPKSEVAP